MDASAGASDDPFAALGLPLRYDIDRSVIERAWLRASARMHHDRAIDDEGAARRLAELNAAKHALVDPEQRGRAMLRTIAGAASDDDPAKDALPEGFLEEVLDTRMRIDEALTAGDAREIERLRAEVSAREASFEAQMTELIDAARTGGDAVRAARRALNAWRYVRRMSDRLAGDDAL